MLLGGIFASIACGVIAYNNATTGDDPGGIAVVMPAILMVFGIIAVIGSASDLSRKYPGKKPPAPVPTESKDSPVTMWHRGWVDASELATTWCVHCGKKILSTDKYCPFCNGFQGKDWNFK